MSELKLDLGAGIHCKEGFKSVDNDASLNPDYVVDLNKLPYPFADDSVDEIRAMQVLEHLSLHSVDFLKECHRILKPNGHLEISLPNSFNYFYRIAFLFGKGTRCLEYNPQHVKFLSPHYLRDLLWHLDYSPKFVGKWAFLPNMARSIHIIARKRN